MPLEIRVVYKDTFDYIGVRQHVSGSTHHSDLDVTTGNFNSTFSEKLDTVAPLLLKKIKNNSPKP